MTKLPRTLIGLRLEHRGFISRRRGCAPSAE